MYLIYVGAIILSHLPCWIASSAVDIAVRFIVIKTILLVMIASHMGNDSLTW